MENLRLNNKPAIKIKAKEILRWDMSIKMNCEGDKVWFPLKYIQINEDGTMLVEEWLYKAKVERDEL